MSKYKGYRVARVFLQLRICPGEKEVSLEDQGSHSSRSQEKTTGSDCQDKKTETTQEAGALHMNLGDTRVSAYEGLRTADFPRTAGFPSTHSASQSTHPNSYEHKWIKTQKKPPATTRRACNPVPRKGPARTAGGRRSISVPPSAPLSHSRKPSPFC